MSSVVKLYPLAYLSPAPKKVFMSPKKEPKKVMKFYDAKSPPTERKKK